LALECGVDLGDLVFGSGQAGLQAFDFAEPSFSFGFQDSSFEIVTDLQKSRSLIRVRPE
jgi:hypothetical protein